jgi:prepilin-type N-terminal cleavage/methylation domain-containing protein
MKESHFVHPSASGSGFWRSRAGAFTLIELLTVIAIVGVLAAILIPTVNSSRVAANRAKTRVQFNQWAAAIAAFRSEYGFYPLFDGSNTVNGGADEIAHPFHDVLAARKRNGSALTAGSSAAVQNKKLISFYAFTESDFTDVGSATPNLLRDGFGATDIAVLVDRNLDGVINSTDFGETLPAVGGIRPEETDFPATGIRAGVAFYSAAPGATVAAPQFVFSWK